jgi:two-component system, NtrC family, sensor histidine kinase HydH
MAAHSTPDRTGWARADAWRIAGLVLLVVGTSALHYGTSPTHVVWHEVFQRLYYLPIVLGAYWYGVPGGLLVAMAASVVYIPHIRSAWAAGVQQQASRYAELVVFNAVGVVVGLLATAQRHVTERYQMTAASLEVANRELRESYEHLRRADRLKALGEVAAGLAHEIRHPLASIGGALEIIESRAAAESPEVEFSRIARNELQRLDRLVVQFLRYARPHEPELREVRVRDIVDRVAGLTRVEADRATVTLGLEIPEPSPPACVDPQQIEQVLLNLVLNAIQASPAGTRVTIREAIEGPDLLIDVLDEGPGVPEEHRSRIFSPFFTTREKGTGLGLAIANRIVTAHGGDIEALQDASRPGGWFRVRLPIAGPPPGPPAAAPETRE